MFFTQKDAEAAAKAIGLDFSAEKFTVDDLLAGMNAELPAPGRRQEAPTSPTTTPQ